MNRTLTAAIAALTITAADAYQDLGTLATRDDMEGLGGTIVFRAFVPRMLEEPSNSVFKVGKWSINILPQEIRGQEWDPENPHAMESTWNQIVNDDSITNMDLRVCGIDCTNRADYVFVIQPPLEWGGLGDGYSVILGAADRWTKVGDWAPVTNFPCKIHVRQVGDTGQLELTKRFPGVTYGSSVSASAISAPVARRIRRRSK